MTQIPSTNMISIAHYTQFVKDDIIEINSSEEAFCPICKGKLKPHGRCIRKLITSDGITNKLSLKVWYCHNCNKSHRELPDCIIPYKRHCTETYAKVNDTDIEELDCDVDEKTIRRIKIWVKMFLEFAAAIVQSLQTEHTNMVTNYNINSTFSSLKYFVRIVVNTNEWKFSVPPFLSS